MRRFWDKVHRCGLDECWEWQAGCVQDGYGHFWFDGKHVYAHRFAWILTEGGIPDDLYVLHKCDNRKCVNPYHLFLGTIADNNKDRDIKGRRGDCGQKLGEEHDQAKLTATDVRSIRRLYDSGHAQYEIANEFGVSQSTVSLIVRFKRWRHV